jgi:hypothetical protein
MNIPSYMAGINFWGSGENDQTFVTPSFSDRMLEVMAVFGTTHLGLSQILLGLPERLMQRHRIAQCRRVRITIIGDEPVPVQVDGEAWLQEPGIIKIEHKNRVQMLARERPDCDYPKAGIDLTPNEILSFAKLATVILRATESQPDSNPEREARNRAEHYVKQQIEDSECLMRSDGFSVIHAAVTLKTISSDSSTADELSNHLDDIRTIPWVGNIPDDPSSPEKTGKENIIRRIFPSKRASLDQVRHNLRKINLPFEVREWDKKCLTTWMENIPLTAEAVAKVISNDITAVQLLYFDSRDVKQLGIRSADAKKLHNEINQLRKLQDSDRVKSN